MSTLAELEVRLDAVANRLAVGIGGLMGKVVSAIGEDLVPATPVLTGFARANWRPSINAPSSGALTFLDPTGAATIEKIRNVAKRVRVGDTVFIVNRAPYIGDLNAGSSPQAEAGFVEAAVESGTARAMLAAKARGVIGRGRPR